MDRTGTASSGNAWHLAQSEFAKRLGDEATTPDSWLERFGQRETVRIEEGNRAYLLVNGKVEERLEPGKHTLDTLTGKISRLGRSKRFTVILLEEGPVTVPMTFGNLRTAGDRLVDIDLEASFTIDDYPGFFKSFLRGREVVTADTLRQDLGDAIGAQLETIFRNYETDDLYGNRGLGEEIQGEIREGCAEVFERNGLSLIDIVSVDYDDDRDQIRQRRHEIDREREEIEIAADAQDLEDRRQKLRQRERERDTDDALHATGEDVREEVGKTTARQQGEHEVEMHETELDHEKEITELEYEQERTEQEHEIDDTERRHRHEAKRENVEHEEGVKTTRTEAEAERRQIEHEQDVMELEDMLDVKAKKDEQKLDRQARKEEIEMRREEHEVETELERLAARDDVDIETLASLAETDEEFAELAKMSQAENLTPEQLDALGARTNDELAKARQEAKKSEHERKRIEEHEEFRDELREAMDESMDRIQETSEKAMDSMADTAEAAAEDTSDNVIVPGSGGGSGSSGDTTIVQGGGSGDSSGRQEDATTEPERVVICPECGSEESADSSFCTDCGTDI